MNFQLYELILIFFIYSFRLVLEVSYAAIETGEFVNRGFYMEQFVQSTE